MLLKPALTISTADVSELALYDAVHMIK